MNILLIDINPELVQIDDLLFTDKQKHEYIYEHLKYYHSKSYRLPVITIAVDRYLLVVAHGHPYLKMAREFKHKYIRGYIPEKYRDNFLSIITEYSEIKILDFQKIKQEDEEELVGYMWFVFFFKKPLSKEEKFFLKKKL